MNQCIDNLSERNGNVRAKLEEDPRTWAGRIRQAGTAAAPATSLIRVVAAAPATSGGKQEELAARPVRKTREPAVTLRAQRKVAWEDDHERARRKKSRSGPLWLIANSIMQNP